VAAAPSALAAGSTPTRSVRRRDFSAFYFFCKFLSHCEDLFIILHFHDFDDNDSFVFGFWSKLARALIFLQISVSNICFIY
jgi:hypothetical protein